MLTMGCAADPGVDPSESGEDESRVSAWSTLVGAYSLDDGQTGEYSTVVFEASREHAGHHYFAESFGALIHCGVGTGCTRSHTRTEGWYTANASARTVTLHPSAGASATFTYALSGDHLTLTRSRHAARYSKATSYCDTPDDCAEEGIVHPLCAIRPGGGWQCGAAHTCSYSCGGGTGAGEGQTCGGFAGIACAAGLTCVYPDGPSHPDQSGTCRTVSGVGGPCGGFTAHPAVCAEGLHCVYSRVPDLPGTCQR